MSAQVIPISVRRPPTLEQLYSQYVRWCGEIGAPAADFDKWRTVREGRDAEISALGRD